MARVHPRNAVLVPSPTFTAVSTPRLDRPRGHGPATRATEFRGNHRVSGSKDAPKVRGSGRGGWLSNASEHVEFPESQGSTALRHNTHVCNRGPESTLSDGPRDRREETGRLSNPVQRRLDRAGAKELARRYLAGVTVTDLAELFGVHRTTVAAHLDRAGVPRRTAPAWDWQTLGEARAMYESGASLAAVGQQFGLDAKTVADRFRHAGIRTRPRKGWPPSPQ